MCPGPNILSSCPGVDGDMPRHETSVLSKETGKLVGRDTCVTELTVFKENPATMHRETSNEVVTPEDVERTGSSVKEKFRNNVVDNVTEKNETIESIVSGKWRHIRSKFPDGFQKHAVFTCGVVVISIVCCLRFIM
jgi:hypothetical protein